MKININKEYLFVALIFVAFIDYDIFVFLALIYFLIYSFYNSEFEFSNLIKRTIYLQVSFFTIFIKFAPILNSKFIKITGAGVVESHPHDVTITREAPNYSRK